MFRRFVFMRLRTLSAMLLMTVAVNRMPTSLHTELLNHSLDILHLSGWCMMCIKPTRLWAEVKHGLARILPDNLPTTKLVKPLTVSPEVFWDPGDSDLLLKRSEEHTSELQSQ